MATHKDIQPPLAFSGKGQLLLFTRYGDPREAGWETKWIHEWNIKETFSWFPKDYICIHKHFHPILEAALKELEQEGLHTEIKTFKECYKVRNISGSKAVLSVHSWGAAIDLNAKENPLGSQGVWSEAFIKVMQKNDIICGMNWEDRKDPMHFSMVNG
jgi:hypothetical protein